MPQYIVVSDPVYKGPAQRPLVPGRDYPRTYREFVEMFLDRRGVCRVPRAPAVAGWVHLPGLRDLCAALAPYARAAGLPGMPLSGLCDRWDDPR